MGLRADSARPQRDSGSVRTVSQPIASHVNFGDDSAHPVDGGLNSVQRLSGHSSTGGGSSRRFFFLGGEGRLGEGTQASVGTPKLKTPRI